MTTALPTPGQVSPDPPPASRSSPARPGDCSRSAPRSPPLGLLCVPPLPPAQRTLPPSVAPPLRLELRNCFHSYPPPLQVAPPPLRQLSLWTPSPRPLPRASLARAPAKLTPFAC